MHQEQAFLEWEEKPSQTEIGKDKWIVHLCLEIRTSPFLSVCKYVCWSSILAWNGVKRSLCIYSLSQRICALVRGTMLVL